MKNPNKNDQSIQEFMSPDCVDDSIKQIDGIPERIFKGVLGIAIVPMLAIVGLIIIIIYPIKWVLTGNGPISQVSEFPDKMVNYIFLNQYKTTFDIVFHKDWLNQNK